MTLDVSIGVDASRRSDISFPPISISGAQRTLVEFFGYAHT